MKLTNIAKTVSVGAVAAAMAVSMTACGGSSSEITATYMLSNASYLDALPGTPMMTSCWSPTLTTPTTCTTRTTFSAPPTPASRATRPSSTAAPYTSEASADGDATHLDVTLSAPTRIYFEQHGKAYGRNGYSTNMMLDTANWTDA